MSDLVRLNLASGTDIKDGWINMDVVAWPTARRPPDILWDARLGKIEFPDNSVDEVYAGYLLLHLAPVYHEPILKEIVRVLKPGARAVFGEVDMRIVMLRWLETPYDRQLSELIWGEQGERAHGLEFADFDKHCWGFTEGKLRSVLHAAGLVNIDRIRVHHQDVFYELTMACSKP